MIYKVRLLENNLKEAIKLKHLTQILEYPDKFLSNPKIILTNEIYDNNGKVLHFSSAKELMLFIIKNKFLPEKIKNAINSIGRKSNKDISLSQAIDIFFEKNITIKNILDLLIFTLPEKEKLGKIINNYESKYNKKLTTDQFLQIAKRR
ncbi:MAG TPA: hypothetical protein PKI46_08835 [Bacteroidales bacterium]|nr:hypothetical protein [Bacteroidales bacterium]